MLQKKKLFSPKLSDGAICRKCSSLLISFVLGLLLVLSGCSTKLPQPKHVVSPLAVDSSPSNGVILQAYRLQVGDELSLRFFYDPGLDTNVIVRPDGRISLQLVGDILVIGLTPEQLRKKLVHLYADTLRKPEVAVMVHSYQQQDVYIAGEVRTPGRQTLKSGMTVLQAIIQSGGFKYGAERGSVIVIRHDTKGKPKFIRVDLEAFMANALPDKLPSDENSIINQQKMVKVASNEQYGYDIQLRPSDIVYVPETTISSVAQFFERYLGAIFPIYKNIGMAFTYEMNDQN
jgi:protein involved in polysaccharide export with SLBB domain